jgi:hypothetical protein
MKKNDTGAMKVKFFLWPSIIISIVGSLLLTLILNLIF